MNFAIYQAFARIPLGIAVTIEFLGPLTVTVAGALAAARHGPQARRSPSRYAALAATRRRAARQRRRRPPELGRRRLGSRGGRSPGRATSSAARRPASACPDLLAWSSPCAWPPSLVTIPGVVEGGGRMFRPDLLAIGAAIGVLSSVIPYWLEMEALRRISTQLFGVWMSLQPAVAALIGLALLSQRLSPAEWLGICCVVTASAAASRRPAAPPTWPRQCHGRCQRQPQPRSRGEAAPEPVDPNASTTGAVNGALRWCACFPV